jgi:hypothetical protein
MARQSEEVEKAVWDMAGDWRQFAEKVRMVIAGLYRQDRALTYVAKSASTRTSIIVGRKTSWRRARSGWLAIPRAKRLATK